MITTFTVDTTMTIMTIATAAAATTTTTTTTITTNNNNPVYLVGLWCSSRCNAGGAFGGPCVQHRQTLSVVTLLGTLSPSELNRV